MLVWILQTGEPLPSDGPGYRLMRGGNLAAALVRRGHRVTLWSSDFFHQEKRHRTGEAARIAIAEGFDIRLIPSRGYSRNIGLGRLLDHLQLGRHLGKELARSGERPDVAFIGYPPIEAACVMGKWLREAGVPYILDIKDQWPDLFVEAVPKKLKFLARALLDPYYRAAVKTMRGASGLCSMSDSFLAWSRRFCGREECASDIVAPLVPGAEAVPSEDVQAAERWWDEQGVRADGKLRCVFVGSLSRAFDFETVAQAAKQCRNAGLVCEWIICGDGERRRQVASGFEGIPGVVMPGWIMRPQIVALGRRCSVFLAPYCNSPNFELNLPNKIIDALGLGLPIVTPLQGEVRALIERFGVGVSYAEGDAAGLTSAIGLLKDADCRAKMGLAARDLFRQRFSFDEVYGRVAARLELLATKADGGQRVGFQAGR